MFKIRSQLANILGDSVWFLFFYFFLFLVLVNNNFWKTSFFIYSKTNRMSDCGLLKTTARLFKKFKVSLAIRNYQKYQILIIKFQDKCGYPDMSLGCHFLVHLECYQTIFELFCRRKKGLLWPPTHSVWRVRRCVVSLNTILTISSSYSILGKWGESEPSSDTWWVWILFRFRRFKDACICLANLILEYFYGFFLREVSNFRQT